MVIQIFQLLYLLNFFQSSDLFDQFLVSVTSGLVTGLVVGIVLLLYQFLYQLKYNDREIVLKILLDMKFELEIYQSNILLAEYFKQNKNKNQKTRNSINQAAKTRMLESLYESHKSAFFIKSSRFKPAKILFEKLKLCEYYVNLTNLQNTNAEIESSIKEIIEYLEKLIDSSSPDVSYIQKQPIGDQKMLHDLLKLSVTFDDEYRFTDEGQIFPWFGKLGDWTELRTMEARKVLHKALEDGIYKHTDNDANVYKLTLKGIIEFAKYQQ